MLKKKIVLKFILGLKVRQLRTRRNLSLKELADSADVSSSYLNEIENGKKYPKIEKLVAIAEALNVNVEELVSFKTGRNLHPLFQFLEGETISKVPLELIGLYESDVVDLMGKDPEKFASFVLTILQLSRSFEISLDDLYKASLRSFIEVNNNYFPALEKMAKKLRNEWALNRVNQYDDLKNLLLNRYNIRIDETTLGQQSVLKEVSYYFTQGTDGPVVYLNPKLQVPQRKFYLLKVLGALLLKNNSQTDDFLKMISDFQSSYFSNAFLLDEKLLIKDIKTFFNRPSFEEGYFQVLLDKYDVSPELLFHRLTQILPSYFKINEIFYLGISENAETIPRYIMNKELHLSQLHRPHGVRMNENYCRKWVAIRSIEELKRRKNEGTVLSQHMITGQISRIEEGTEYFSISLARKSILRDKEFQSFTIGFLINKELQSSVKFLADNRLKKFTIGQTCERCPQTDCTERAAPPSLYENEKLKMDREFQLSLL